MISLYQITEEQRRLYDQIMEAEGELTPEIEEQLEINEENLHIKVENYVIFLDSLSGQQDLVEKEIKRLQEMKKSIESKIKKLENNLTFAVEIFGNKNTGKKTVLAELQVFNTRKVELKEATTLVVKDPHMVEEQFVTVVNEYKVDKKALREAIDKGIVSENENIYIERSRKVNIK